MYRGGDIYTSIYRKSSAAKVSTAHGEETVTWRWGGHHKRNLLAVIHSKVVRCCYPCNSDDNKNMLQRQAQDASTFTLNPVCTEDVAPIFRMLPSFDTHWASFCVRALPRRFCDKKAKSWDIGIMKATASDHGQSAFFLPLSNHNTSSHTRLRSRAFNDRTVLFPERLKS